MDSSESNGASNGGPPIDRNRKPPKSNDPAWKYGFQPDPKHKDLTQCKLCNRRMWSGAIRLKQHLAGGFKDVVKCPNTTTAIIKEMLEAIAKGSKKKSDPLNDEPVAADHNLEGIVHGFVQEVSVNEVLPGSDNSSKASSSASAASSKRQKMTFSFTLPPSSSKSVVSMIRKTPEEVIEERHRKGPHQTTLEMCTKSEEEKHRAEMHVANFFYENGIPFNVANSRSYEIMVESIGQLGPGWKPPTYHKLRLPLLEKAKKETGKLKERHERSWKLYGCSLMCDGWTDMRSRHLINFLVNGQEGTFFLCSVDVSNKIQHARLLADLIEDQINLIGREYVVQVVTDNGANFKAAGKLLCDHIPTLYWTPCAAHCLDLMLEDIAKIKVFNVAITRARNITTFIYRHVRLLSAMREKTGGKDLVRPGATRFATAFLTLQSLYKNREALRKLFGGEEWFDSLLAKTVVGAKVHDTVLSVGFWNNVADCIRASQPLLIVLRIVDGDEIPAMAEVCVKMDEAKQKINEGLEKTQRLSKKVLSIIEKRWESQMEVDLYGAALFLNPGKFYGIQEDNIVYSSQLRTKFNGVLEKMVIDRNLREKISSQVDQYENVRGYFARQMTIDGRKSKNPVDWWTAFGGHTIELAMFAKRIVGLCCSSSGCERNWSTFESIHTKKRNRLEHDRLNDLVYIRYNRKIATRFQIRREENTNFDLLVVEEFQWENEWVNGNVVDVVEDDEFWNVVDRSLEASQGVENRRSTRHDGSGSSSQVHVSFDTEVEENANLRILNDDIDVDDVHEDIPTTSTQGRNDREADDAVELDDYI